MATKDEYIAMFKRQLDEWESELEELKARAETVAEAGKARLQQQIDELQAKWEDGRSKIGEWVDSADDLWDDVKDEAEEKWTALKDTVQDSVKRIKSYFA